MEELIDNGSGNSSTNEENPLRDSPFGRLSEVLSNEELANLFSGVGGSEGGGSSFGGGGTGGAELPYNGNPFAGDNFWNIFAGGVNPSAPSTGGSNQGNPTDPLTGGSSAVGDISTTEIPDGFSLRVTIDSLINSRLEELPDNIEIPSFNPGEIPSFGGSGETPSFGGGGIPSFGGSGETPSFGGGGGIPSFGGGGETPSFGSGGEIPSFGGGGGGGIPSFGGGGGGMPSFGGR